MNANTTKINNYKPRIKSILALPNILFILLLFIISIQMYQKYGLSIATFARSLGICAIPILFCIIWNSVRGDAKVFKYIFVLTCCLFVLMSLLSYFQISIEDKLSKENSFSKSLLPNTSTLASKDTNINNNRLVSRTTQYTETIDTFYGQLHLVAAKMPNNMSLNNKLQFIQKESYLVYPFLNPNSKIANNSVIQDVYKRYQYYVSKGHHNVCAYQIALDESIKNYIVDIADR